MKKPTYLAPGSVLSMGRLLLLFWGEGRLGKKTVTGEGSLVLLVGPSSIDNLEEILEYYYKKEEESALRVYC